MLRQGVRRAKSTFPPPSENALYGFVVAATGSLDSARYSLREGLAALKMTGQGKGKGRGTSPRPNYKSAKPLFA
jgi:hypothetical protein